MGGYFSKGKFHSSKDSFTNDDSHCLQNSSNKVTSYRWMLHKPKKQWANCSLNNQPTMFSSSFNLHGQPSIDFAFYIDTKFNSMNKKSFGIVAQNIDKLYQIKVNTKIWIEDTRGKKISEVLVREHVFSKGDSRCGFDGFNIDIFYDRFVNPRGSTKDLIICCELTELDSLICDLPISELELLQEFHKNQWTLFEKNVHDAVIKVEDVEFKVLKSFFIAHSEVFKQMFKEDSTIEIKDISKQTMQHLIKWFYTGQIEVESSIEELFEASDKYDINLLKKICVEIMLITFDNENVFPRLVLAVIHKNNELKEASLKFATLLSGTDWAKFTMSSEWVEFVRKNPKIPDELIELVQEKLKF